MNKDHREFVEQVGIFGATNGSQRSVARITGYLLVCDPTAQSAKQIQDALQLSAGAVNNALKLLRNSGIIRPVALPGTRSLLYELDPHSWKRTLEERLRIVPDTLAMVEIGLKLMPNNERLLLIRRVYRLLKKEITPLLKKLDAIK